VKQVLTEGVNKWGILNSDYRIREPKDLRVKQAWSFLNKNITKDGWVTFDNLISKLLQPPFGYDDYTVTFLLSAWIGKHKHELGFKDHRKTSNRVGNGQNLNSINVTLGELQSNLNKSKEFVKYLRANVAVQHSGEAIQTAAKSYLRQIQDIKDVSEAERLIAQSAHIVKTLTSADPLVLEINDAVDQLAKWLKEAKSIERSLGEYRQIIAQSEDLPRLVKTQIKLNDFGIRSEMQSNSAFVETMRLIEAKIDAVAQKQAQTKLIRIEAYDAAKEKLDSSRQALSQINRLDLVSLFMSAIEQLDKDYLRLQSEAKELPIFNELNATKVSGMPLRYLQDQLGRIETIIGQPFSSRTQQLAESKKQQIGKEIDRLNAFLTGLSSRVDNVKELVHAEVLQSEILRNEFLYRETGELETLSTELERLKERISDLRDREDKAKAEIEAKRQRHIEALTAQSISREYKKIRDVNQRFVCLSEMLNSDDGIEFSTEQKEQLRALLS
jgi:hypothetical protein